MSRTHIPLQLKASVAPLAFAPDCSSGIGSASCNLYGLLHILYVAAGVLAAILVVVIAFAVHAWRKTKETDITHP